MKKLSIRKMVSLVLVCLMGILLIGCDGQKDVTKDESTSDVEKKEEKIEVVTETVNIDNSWYADDASAITDGLYIIGDDIAAGSYTFTNNEKYGYVAIFETMDNYKAYHESRRGTIGELGEALGNNVFALEYLDKGESYSVRLDEGFVVLVDGFKGTLKNVNGTDGSDDPINGKIEKLVDGLYRSGDIEEGTYILSKENSNGGGILSVIVFENEEAYDDFMDADQSTIENCGIAVEQNALYEAYLDDGESCYLHVNKDNIIVIKHGPGYLEPVKMGWAK